MTYVCPHCGASARGTMAETWAWDKAHRTECTERPTPTSDLEARIAEIADDAIGYECKHQDFGNPLHEDAPGKCHHCYQIALKIAAALLPLIREREAEAWEEGYVCLQVGINPYKEKP